MADNWEIDHGLNPNDAADRNDDDNGDGYTNLEEYLYELAGDSNGSNVGKGIGPDPDPTCGYSFNDQTGPTIHSFVVSPPAIKAGEQVTISWDADADACKRSWDNTDPFLLSGSQTVTLTESTSLDLICTASGTDDWMNRYVFVTPDGQMPIPSFGFTADKTNLSYGEEVTFTWRAGTITQFEAGECKASGAWNGFKTTAGAESFLAMYSGDYSLTCTGPGGASTETITLNVAGGPPAPPPAPTPAGSGSSGGGESGGAIGLLSLLLLLIRLFQQKGSSWNMSFSLPRKMSHG